MIVKEGRRRYRHRRRHATGSATKEQIKARIAYYGERCWMCGVKYDNIDHVIPLARGGPNWPANLRPACEPCNSRKGDQMPVIALRAVT